MALTPEKIEQAKKIFNVTDKDIERVITGASVSAPSSTPQPQSQGNQGDFMQRLLQSRVLPVGGAVLGGGIGTLAGPVAGAAGAGAGAMGGDIIRKELAGLLGKDIGEPGVTTSGTTPQQAATSVLKTGKTGLDAAKLQAIGEVSAGLLKFLKPGTTSGLFSNITDFLSNRGKGQITKDVLKTRFLNETLPKALQSSGEMVEEKIVGKGEQLLGGVAARVLDPQELNFIRKQFNAVGKGQMKSDLVKFLANDLARIIKEEQLKLVPEAGPSILAQRLARQVPQAFRQLPFGRFFLGTGQGANQGLLGLVGGGISNVGQALGRFILPGMAQKSTQNNE